MDTPFVDTPFGPPRKICNFFTPPLIFGDLTPYPGVELLGVSKGGFCEGGKSQ